MSRKLGWAWGKDERWSLDAGETVDLGWNFGKDNIAFGIDSDGWVTIEVLGNDQKVTLVGITKDKLPSVVSSLDEGVKGEILAFAQSSSAPAPVPQVPVIPVVVAPPPPAEAPKPQTPSSGSGKTVNLGWSWGEKKAVDFDPNKDRLELGWNFGPNNLGLGVSSDGWVKIEVKGNEQEITFKGLSWADVSRGNVHSNDEVVMGKLLNFSPPVPSAPAPVVEQQKPVPQPEASKPVPETKPQPEASKPAPETKPQPEASKPSEPSNVGTFQNFQDSLRAFESGINPDRIDWYKENWDNPIITYSIPGYTPSGGRYPLTDDKGRLLTKLYTVKEWFDVLELGGMFDPKTGTKQDLHNMQFKSTNTWGFVGYQMGEAVALEAGIYKPRIDPASGLPSYYIWTADTQWLPEQFHQVVTLPWGTKIDLTRGNFWEGEFSGKHGITSLQDLKDEAKQELAIQDVWKNNYDYIAKNLKSQGYSWDDVIYKTWEYKGEEVKFSLSGMIAASHLGGASATVDFLTGKGVASDETGTSVAFYFKEFGGRATPWGTSASETLDGNKYNNTFWTAGGSDTVATYGGRDSINVVQGKKGQVDRVVVMDFDLGNDEIIFKNFDGARAASVLEESDGVHIWHISGGSEVILKGISLETFEAAGGLNKFVHFSNDYQMTWDGSVEKNRTLEGFDLDYDRLITANGGAFEHLMVKGVYDKDGHAMTKLTFAHDDKGWEGGGYLIDQEVSTVAQKLGTVISGAWGDPKGADVRERYEVKLQADTRQGFFTISPDGGWTGTKNDEDISGLGRHKLGNFNGGGGSDHWIVSSSSLPWWGLHKAKITDFDPSSGDKLDFSDVIEKGGKVIFFERAYDGDSHANVYRDKSDFETGINLTFAQISIQNPNGGGYYDWDSLVRSGAVIL